jgi:hypothetical protein
MFNKSNGRALTVANVILLAQFIFSMVCGIWVLAFFLFPTDKSSSDVHLLVQDLAPGLIALALGFIVNKVFKIFDKNLAYEHKLFNLVSMLVVDGAICSIIMELNNRAAGVKVYDTSLNSEVSSIITYVAAVALTYKIPMFKNEYSKTLNTINLFCYFGFIFNFAWMLSTIILGAGSNKIEGAEIFAHILIGLSLLGVIIYLVKNAKKLSGPEEAAEPKKVEAVTAEPKAQDADIKAELEATRQELKELKELLKEKKD